MREILVSLPDDGSEPIVCCRDADGRPVRRPRAAGSPGIPVLDAHEPCPACGAVDFEEYRPFEAWPGGEIADDGQATMALMLTAPTNCWAAVAVRGSLTIIDAGHDLDPDALGVTPVADPARAFGPQPARA